MVPVVQRLDLLHPLAPTQLVRVGRLEEARRELDQPLRVNRHHLSHELFRRQHELMVQHPICWLLEQCTGGVYVHRLLLHNRLVPLLGVLPRGMEEEPARDSLLDLPPVAPSRHHFQFVAVHDGQQLLPDVLRPPERSSLERPVNKSAAPHRLTLTQQTGWRA